MADISDRLELKIIEAKELLHPDGSPPSAYVEIIIGPGQKKIIYFNFTYISLLSSFKK
jgi:hypothetical protein